MPKHMKPADEIEEFLTVEEYKEQVEKLETKVKTLRQKIETLEHELKIQQDREEANRRKDRAEFYPLMAEMMRARGLASMFYEDLLDYKRRAEHAERSVRNLKKWIEINYEGGSTSGTKRNR